MRDVALIPLLGAALLGLVTMSSSLLDTVIGFYCPFSKRALACVLAFAASALISALAIAFQSVQELRHHGLSIAEGWEFAGGGFALVPEAIEDGGLLVVLPTVAGFLFAFYLSLVETLGP